MKVAAIKENYVFRRIYSRGKSAATSRIVLYCQKNKLGRSRYGFTVSRKLGCAVKRNRVRRRLREIARLEGNRLRTGYDYIVVVRARGIEAPYRALEADFLALADKLGVRTA